MKKALRVVELLFGLAFALAAVLLLLFVCSFLFPKRADHDVWDIATAIGTVGSTVAAVWFATAEARRRRRTELQTAELVAAGIALRLIHDLHSMQATIRWLKRAREMDYPAQDFAEIGESLRTLCTWTTQDLLPLVPLLGNGAHSLASAADRVRLCADVMTGKTGNGAFTDTSEKRRVLAKEAYGWLNEATDLIGPCIEPCRRVAHSLTTVMN